MRRTTDRPRAGTQSLRRAVSLLRELSTRMAGGWTLTELATQCELDRTTAHRMLDGLMREGLVSRHEPTRRYVLGPMAFELGLAAAPRFDPRGACAAGLQRLAERTGDTIFLSVRSGGDTVCVDRREGSISLKALVVDVGARRSLVATAGGVAVLLALAPAERRRAVASCLARLRPADAAHRTGIRRMLERSEAAGYGLNCDDITPGISALGAPILSPDGTPVAAITVASTSQRLDERRRRKVLELLVREAAALRGRVTTGAAVPSTGEER
jgi:DNA-binding IclR family transcriptional regulator